MPHRGGESLILESTSSWSVLSQHAPCAPQPHPAPFDNGESNDGDAAAAPPLSLPPLNLLAKQHSLSEEEIGAGCVLPPQRRITAQIMRHWGPHVTALQEPPSARCLHLRTLHCTHMCIATSRKEEGEPEEGATRFFFLTRA